MAESHKRVGGPSAKPPTAISAAANARSASTTIPKRNPQTPRGRHEVPLGIHILRPRHRIANRHGHDLVAAYGDHLAEVFGRDEIGCCFAEAAGEDAVERDRGSAALDVAENGDADLEIDVLGDVGGDLIGDAAEAACGFVEIRLLAADALRSLGHKADVELRALALAALHHLHDLLRLV